MLKGHIQLKNPKKVENDINRIFVQLVNRAMRSAVKPIKLAIQQQTELFLSKSKFAEAIFNGNLAGHLGFERGNEHKRLSGIITILIKGIKVIYEPLKLNGTTISSGILTIGIGLNDFDDIRNSAEAIIVTEKLDFLNWVEWTLINGDTVVILGYDIKFQPGKGRSGQAIMIERANKFWRVPPPFDGTLEDNWITREIEVHLSEYAQILEQTINLELQKVST